MSLAERDFKVNDIVFAKVRGYAAWPAVIQKLIPSNQPKQAEVVFYSDLKERYLKFKK